MATITTRPDVPNKKTLDILDFSDDEKRIILALFGSIRLRPGCPVRSVVSRLEDFFGDDEFEDAFDNVDLFVYMDGVKQDPMYVELEVKIK